MSAASAAPSTAAPPVAAALADSSSEQKLYQMRALYPSSQPYVTGRLLVPTSNPSISHDLYYERLGNPKGKPVVFLHGGPGAGCNDGHRRLFDPEVWDVILWDQRGAGRSVVRVQQQTASASSGAGAADAKTPAPAAGSSGSSATTAPVSRDLKHVLQDNTTWDLVEDIERLRKHLGGIERCVSS
jgi:pimeloyl-ACP methyl ester carboxylesterase